MVKNYASNINCFVAGASRGHWALKSIAVATCAIIYPNPAQKHDDDGSNQHLRLCFLKSLVTFAPLKGTSSLLFFYCIADEGSMCKTPYNSCFAANMGGFACHNSY
jgi:hypothetical protein